MLNRSDQTQLVQCWRAHGVYEVADLVDGFDRLGAQLPEQVLGHGGIRAHRVECGIGHERDPGQARPPSPAFPLGYFISSWFVANTTYAIAYLWALIFQAVYLLPLFIEDMKPAGATGDAVTANFPLSYGAVTLGMFLLGFLLVRLGRWARQHRTARAAPNPANA